MYNVGKHTGNQNLRQVFQREVTTIQLLCLTTFLGSEYILGRCKENMINIHNLESTVIILEYTNSIVALLREVCQSTMLREVRSCVHSDMQGEGLYRPYFWMQQWVP